MNEAKLLAELMLQLSIYFESDTDDIEEWLMTNNSELSNIRPVDLLTVYKRVKEVHQFVMENMQ